MLHLYAEFSKFNPKPIFGSAALWQMFTTLESSSQCIEFLSTAVILNFFSCLDIAAGTLSHNALAFALFPVCFVESCLFQDRLRLYEVSLLQSLFFSFEKIDNDIASVLTFRNSCCRICFTCTTSSFDR